MKTILVGRKLGIEDVCRVAEGGVAVGLDPAALKKVRANRRLVEAVLDGTEAVYGINTGFGPLSDVRIGRADLSALQLNLIRSHSAGTGRPLERPFVRAMMLLRAANLAWGHSGVRPEVVESLLAFLNEDIVPVIPEKGSVGASGDLAPLAHLALALIGEGEVFEKGTRRPAEEVLRRRGVRPLRLEAKEGLALINGTQFMSALGCLGLGQAENLARHADLVAALTIEGVMGSFAPFDPRISRVRPHRGQTLAARNLRALSAHSEISESHRDCGKVQDPYSLRCVPQVHGAVRDALAYLRATLAVEINSVTDNPLVFDTAIISGGNFHGEPLALALDFACLAVTELGGISERRIDKLLTPAFNSGLPAFLVRTPGLHSGFMIPQYTAAALVNECKVLSAPASVDSIPTSLNKEDHVSMGATSARKFLEIADNVETVLAIELMIAVEACEQRRPLRPALPLRKAIRRVRAAVPPLTQDRVLAADIEACKKLVRGRSLLDGLDLA